MIHHSNSYSETFGMLISTQFLFQPGKHTIFGRVSRGMEIIKRLGSVQTDNNDRYVVSFKINHLQILYINQQSCLKQFNDTL
jgi:cyclophilin family peptidyl-prolyl cis-trans isomerase